MVSFVPFHGLSPMIELFRTIFATCMFLWVFGFIFLFPFLEDLSVVSYFGVPTENGSDFNGLLTTAYHPPVVILTRLSLLPAWEDPSDMVLGGRSLIDDGVAG